MRFTHLTGITQYHASERSGSMPGNHSYYFPSFAFDASTTQTVSCSRLVIVANLQKIRNSLIQIPSDLTMEKQCILFAYIWLSDDIAVLIQHGAGDKLLSCATSLNIRLSVTWKHRIAHWSGEGRGCTHMKPADSRKMSLGSCRLQGSFASGYSSTSTEEKNASLFLMLHI